MHTIIPSFSCYYKIHQNILWLLRILCATALQFFAAWIPTNNSSCLSRSCSLLVFHMIHKIIEILSDLLVILHQLCSANTCLLALWLCSICLATFISILCHCHFEPLIWYVCEWSQSSVKTRIRPFSSDVSPNMSRFSANQTLINCRSMSIQLTYLLIRASASDPPFWKS